MLGAWPLGGQPLGGIEGLTTVAQWYLTAAVSGDGWPTLQVGGTAPSEAATATGWLTTGVPAGWMARMAGGLMRPASAFANVTEPAAGPDATLRDAFRTEGRWDIDLPAGDWVLDLSSLASAGTGADLRYRCRIWTSPNADGSGATERSTAVGVSSAITDLGLTPQAVTATIPVAAISATGVYVFAQIAAEVL